MPSLTPARSAMLMLLVCVFFWGSVFPLAKMILQEISGLSLVIWRFLLASVCLALYLLARQTRWVKLQPRQFVTLALLGVLGVGGFNLALFEGLPHTDATNAALVMALNPLTTSVLAALMARRWLTGWQWSSLLMGLSGVALVITRGDLHLLQQQGVNHGDLLIVLGMFCWSLFVVLSQRVNHWLPSMQFTLLTMVSGSLAIAFFSLFDPAVHPWPELQQLSTHSIWLLVYVSLFGTVVAYLFWNQGAAQLGPAKAALFFNLVPVFAALVGLALGQPLTNVQMGGMLLVIAGLTLPGWLQRQVQRRQAALAAG